MYLIIVAAIVLFLTIIEAIERKKVNKISLIIAIINLIIVAALSVLYYYPDFDAELLLFQQIYFAYTIFSYILLAMLTLFNILRLVLENRELKLLTQSDRKSVV